ncbi:MAG: hypothetical protein ACR2FN_06885 [Chitinophagaceae bacterium]
MDIFFRKRRETQPELNFAIPLSVAGFILTLIAGFLGWALVQKYHVGVDAFTEDEKIISSRKA